jgi:hypothetical protein
MPLRCPSGLWEQLQHRAAEGRGAGVDCMQWVGVPGMGVVHWAAWCVSTVVRSTRVSVVHSHSSPDMHSAQAVCLHLLRILVALGPGRASVAA